MGAKLLCAYVVVVPLGSAAVSPVALPLVPETLSSALAGAVVAAVIVEFVIWPERRASLPSGARLWLAFLGFAALSHAWSINRTETATDVTALGSLIAMAAIVSARRFSRRDLDVLQSSLIVSAAMSGLIAVYQWRTDTLDVSESVAGRFALVGDDPNHTAAALLLPAGAALVAALESSERASRRVAAAVAFALAGVAVVLTASRGGLLALTVLVVAVFVQRLGLRRTVALILPALVLLIALPLPADQRAPGGTGREQIWTIGVVSCKDGCWFGSGLGTFPDIHEQTAIARPEMAVLELRFAPHNVWLGTLVEVGVVGLVLLAAIMACTFGVSLQSPHRLREAASAGVLAMLVASFFINALQFKYFWLVILVATVIAQPSRSPVELERPAGRLHA